MEKNIRDEDKCRKCDSEDVLFVEYDALHPDHYDGISEVLCNKCGTRFGRWSGKELAKGETEKRYGKQDK